jgi:Xaa-Pro aminopeptidase
MVDGFLAAQRLAYAAAKEVAAQLAPGDTERDACAMLRANLASRGVDTYFHVPFAWFGDRTRLAGFHRRQQRFFPTRRKLTHGMHGILDLAPVVRGCTADIGYSFCCAAGSAALDDARAVLHEVRDAIPAWLGDGRTMPELYTEVDSLLAQRGYDNCHREYPFSVIAHRVERAPERRSPEVLGFGMRFASALLGRELAHRAVGHGSPLWHGRSDGRPAPGLWAFEPHIGRGQDGFKFEELLLIDESGARWIDAPSF